MGYTVYILFSSKLDKHYIGFTENFDQRIEFHLNENKSKKFTYKADDWKLVFSLICQTKSQGLSIEKHIKLMKSKVYIQNLIRYSEISLKLLEKYK